VITKWPTATLGNVLTKSDNWIDIKPDERYRQVTVRLWGKGVVQRGEVSGAEIAAARQLAVCGGQFILSRIDARNGAFGLVPRSLDGAVVSNDFPTFMVNTQRVLPSYLDWLSKTRNFIDLCKAASEGTTNRVRLKEDRFLATAINLPPLNEQRRIVTRIEELAAKIEEARGLRRQAVEEAGSLVPASIHSMFSNLCKGEKRALSEIVEIANGQGLNERDRDQSGKYAVYGSGGQVGTHSTAVSADPFVVIGRKGSAGKATYAPNGGWVTDTAYYAFPRNTDELSCKYLFHAIQSLDFSQDVITTAIPGINRTAIYKHRIPVPRVEEQLYIENCLDGLQKKIDVLKSLQTETAAELDVLLPSVLDKAFSGEL